MREIKFRAWDKDSEEMVGWEELIGYCDIDYLFGNHEHVPNFDVMQYTGLKDKDDKEIYEGDIVKVMDVTLAVVKYSENRGAYYLDCEDKIGDVGLICQYDTIEAIGNMYENPDLLEGANG